VELRQLEYFAAVAAELNFSRAAQRTHVVQSALSVAVAKLEKELGVALFDRTRRQIALTAAGEVFLEHSREVIHAAHRAQSSVDDYHDQLSGTVTLGTLMSWGAVNLPAALAQFGRRNPLVTVLLRQSLTGSAGHLTAIADGQMDLALVSITEPPSPLIALRELTSEPMVFVCAQAHPLADQTQVRVADLTPQELIQFPAGWGIRRSLDAAFAMIGARPRSTYEVADYAIAAEFIRHQLATAVLPSSAANRFPDLRAIEMDPPLTWTLSIASAAPQYVSRAASAVVDTLIDHVDDL
jgi:DNA-binding transcriptional LysR family regulator